MYAVNLSRHDSQNNILSQVIFVSTENVTFLVTTITNQHKGTKNRLKRRNGWYRRFSDLLSVLSVS